MREQRSIKNAVTALSLANLCFLAAWCHLLYPPFHGYHLKGTPGWANYLAVMLDVLLLAVLFFAAVAFIESRQHRARLIEISRLMFLLITFVALNNIRIQVFGHLTAPALIAITAGGQLTFLIACFLIFCCVAIVLVRWPHQLSVIAQVILLILAPFALVTFATATWALVKRVSPTASAKSQPRAIVNTNIRRSMTRVLWIIFDELDYRATFAARPASIKLPEFDRLRNESLFATNAYPPAGETLLSMPALIAGRIVTEAREASPNELLLTFADATERVAWSAQQNIFSRAQSIGGTTAIVGWYHPYCRVIGSDLTKCSSNDVSFEKDLYGQTLVQSMLKDVREFWLSIPLVRDALSKFIIDDESYEVKHIGSLKASLAQAKEVAADPDLSLVLIHYPTPHPPCAYNRWRGDFAVDGKCNYFDNLELADRVLGELRNAIERAGLWDQTTVLVSSDHWWRTQMWEKQRGWTEEEAQWAAGGKADHRIPFILKLKNQRQSLIYDQNFNTILTEDLLLAILNDELATTDEVKAWLDKRALHQ